MLEFTVNGDFAMGDYKAILSGGKSQTGEAQGYKII